MSYGCVVNYFFSFFYRRVKFADEEEGNEKAYELQIYLRTCLKNKNCPYESRRDGMFVGKNKQRSSHEPRRGGMFNLFRELPEYVNMSPLRGSQRRRVEMVFPATNMPSLRDLRGALPIFLV
jgi:hypothetical protein